MKLEAYLIGFVVFSFFIVAGMLIIQDINTNYDGIIDAPISTSQFNSTYDSASAMYNTSQSMKDNVLGGEVSDTNFIDSSYKGAYQAIRLIGGSFGLVGGIINAVAVAVGIPKYMVGFALTAIVISIIFSIIYIIIRFK